MKERHRILRELYRLLNTFTLLIDPDEVDLIARVDNAMDMVAGVALQEGCQAEWCQ